MFWVHLVSGSVWHPGPPRLQGLRAWPGLQWVPEPRWAPATWSYGPCPPVPDHGRGAVPQSPCGAGQGRRDRPVWRGRRPWASEGSPGGRPLRPHGIRSAGLGEHLEGQGALDAPPQTGTPPPRGPWVLLAGTGQRPLMGTAVLTSRHWLERGAGPSLAPRPGRAARPGLRVSPWAG